MADENKSHKAAVSDDEEELPDFKDKKKPAEVSSAASPETTAAASADPPNTPENSKKRAAADLSAIYEATPGHSKNKSAMKDLVAERKQFKRNKTRPPSGSVWNRSGKSGSSIRRAS